MTDQGASENDDYAWEREDPDPTLYAQGRVPDRTYLTRGFTIDQDQSQDFGQPARFVYKVFDPASENRASFEGDEWVIKETPAGRYQFKLLIAREAGAVKEMWIQRVPPPGSPGKVKLLLNLGREDAARLIELLRNLEYIPVSGDRAERVDDALVRDLFADPDSLVRLYRRHPERFRSLISDDKAAQDVVAVAHRRNQVDHFRRLLSEPEFFEAEAALRGGRREDVWQTFFEANPWILGVTLAGQLLTSWSDEKLEQVVAGASIASVGKRADALLRTAGRIRSMVFAEFKTHDADLLERTVDPYRSGCWAPSKELSRGVAQVQGTVHRAISQVGDHLADKAPDGSHIPGMFTYLIRPRSFLIIGQLSELVGEAGGDHQDRIRSFELYRSHLAEPEVVTFDELLARAEWYVAAAPPEDP